ncbi:hypothetical protein F5Y16DRAFT_401314 [Xylariaceae sp. FL0255]|nr:hypothetical protein F5Y16DRAFT_401314 [Xylariaceae sp. FL0255]
MTEGSFLLGLIFTTYLSNSQGLDTILGADYASLSATSSYESQSNLTFIVTADPILLASPKLSVVKAATTTIAPNNSASAPRPNNGNGNGNGATNSGTSQVSRSNAIRQATLIGVPIISFAMLVFGILMFVRYRRRQRLLRGLSQELSEGQADEKDTEKSPIDKTTSIWQLKPELDASRAFAELEGTNVEEAGPGIHVSKPELEASLGIAGLVGVYVKYKAELDVPSATG